MDTVRPSHAVYRRVLPFVLGSIIAVNISPMDTSMTGNPHVKEQGIAGLLTLIALRAILPEHDRSTLATPEVIIDGARFATESEAATHLARMPKPVRCRAHVHGGGLVVHCESMAEEAGIASWRAATELLVRADVAYLRRGRGQRDEDPLLVARGDSRELLVPLNVYARWRTDFEIPNLAFSVQDKPENVPDADRDASLTFWNSGTDRIEGRLRILPPSER